ncbi:MAG TPA: hypothetical protein VGJ81_05450 [Thermoanaerobaculia bacterium]|jgi:hypothetical protein
MATKKAPKKETGTKKSGPSKATHLALLSVADDVDCRTCVIHTIEAQCNTTVGSLGDKLKDVCSPCDTGAMADLADALRQKCGASGDLNLTCSMSIIQVIHAVCG